MTLNFHKKPQRDFVFHFFFNFYYSLKKNFFVLYFFFQHADVHATACWRIGSYAPGRILYMYATLNCFFFLILVLYAFVSLFVVLFTFKLFACLILL